MSVFRTFSAPFKLFVATRGDALHSCPWLSYPAPLALPIALAHSAFGAADRAGSFRLWALPIALAHSAFGAADRAGSFRLWRCPSPSLIPLWRWHQRFKTFPCALLLRLLFGPTA